MSLTIDSHFGEAEAQRHKEIRAQRHQEQRAKKREKRKEQVSHAFHRCIMFLFLVTAITFVYLYKAELKQELSLKLNQVTAARHHSSRPNMLEQSALNHEKEVDSVVQ